MKTNSDVKPHFSERAARRVTNWLPAPTECPHCGGSVRFASNDVVYGRTFGEWPWLYICENRPCRAYVGTHPHTSIPLGTLATAEIRAARKRAKELFNPLWQSGRMERREAYRWLADKLGIPEASCHIGWFDKARCDQVVSILMEPAPAVRLATVADLERLRAALGRPAPPART